MKRLSRARHLLPFLLVALCAAPALAAGGAANIERIPFALPALKADAMPPVFFSHEKHAAAVEAQGGDCFTCHADTPSGMSEYFLNTESVPPGKAVAAVHDGCVSCHAAARPGAPTGPLLASCRACHSESVAKSMQKPAPARGEATPGSAQAARP